MQADIVPKIPKNSHWLDGEGAGTWFHFEKLTNNEYRIRRFTPEGELDCDRVFEVNNTLFDIEAEYKIQYISHCQECNVLQNNNLFTFRFLRDFYTPNLPKPFAARV